MNKCVNCDECKHRSETCLCDISNNEDTCPLIDNILFQEYDKAIIGQSTNGNVIYDYNLMIECVQDFLNMNLEDAILYIDKNVEPTLCYYQEPKPIIMYRIDECEDLLNLIEER